MLTSNGKNRRRRQGPPPGDHLRPRPVRRSPEQIEEARVMALLSYDWCLLSPDDGSTDAALEAAYTMGQSWAEERGDAPPTPDMFVESAIGYAVRIKVISDVERLIWEAKATAPDNDPRFVAFARGYVDYMRRRRAKCLTPKPAREPRSARESERSTRRLDDLDYLVERVRVFVRAGGDARTWLDVIDDLNLLDARTRRELEKRIRRVGLL